jgi:hypothetical protein
MQLTQISEETKTEVSHPMEDVKIKRNKIYSKHTEWVRAKAQHKLGWIKKPINLKTLLGLKVVSSDLRLYLSCRWTWRSNKSLHIKVLFSRNKFKVFGQLEWTKSPLGKPIINVYSVLTYLKVTWHKLACLE